MTVMSGVAVQAGVDPRVRRTQVVRLHPELRELIHGRSLHQRIAITAKAIGAMLIGSVAM